MVLLRKYFPVLMNANVLYFFLYQIHYIRSYIEIFDSFRVEFWGQWEMKVEFHSSTCKYPLWPEAYVEQMLSFLQYGLLASVKNKAAVRVLTYMCVLFYSVRQCVRFYISIMIFHYHISVMWLGIWRKTLKKTLQNI